ncbi:receptor-like protein kinase THESEUS 1 [Senna tora]|uniref:Receptor-like protein kinase THESEUS 1 n=1 Tax=Senna tora TaxID=362788 RepID=A0A834WUT5_9FABA|nr:receptor-like protein kinase THESEUS 1 [Senna tora]
MENPKQSRARDFPHLPPNQTLPLPWRRRLLLLHSPEALVRFLRRDLLQRDDGAERSDATRRRCRDICPVAMDPPSMWAAKRVLGSMDIEKVKWMFALRASDSGIGFKNHDRFEIITAAGRTFIADSQHSTVRFQSQSSVFATINSSNISPIYQSTRIFTGLASVS